MVCRLSMVGCQLGQPAGGWGDDESGGRLVLEDVLPADFCFVLGDKLMCVSMGCHHHHHDHHHPSPPPPPHHHHPPPHCPRVSSACVVQLWTLGFAVLVEHEISHVFDGQVFGLDAQLHLWLRAEAHWQAQEAQGTHHSAERAGRPTAGGNRVRLISAPRKDGPLYRRTDGQRVVFVQRGPRLHTRVVD